MSPRPSGCRKHGLEFWYVKRNHGRCRKCSREHSMALNAARREVSLARSASKRTVVQASPIPDQSVAERMDLWSLAHGHTGDLIAWERAALRERLAGLRTQEALP